jgi:putative ABC transport system permease protein
MLGTTFTLAIRSILRHKLRSFLTTLGIIIGVAAVVAMVTLGNATTAAVQQQIASLGTNILQVRPGQGFGRGGGGPRPPDFEQQDVEAVSEQIAGVTAVAPQAQATGTAIYNGANWSTTINGTGNAFFEVQPWPLTGGRTFSPAEEAAGKAVCIIGNTVRQNLFRGGEAIGRRIRDQRRVVRRDRHAVDARAGGVRRRSGRCRDHADQDGAAALFGQSRHPRDAGRGGQRL